MTSLSPAAQYSSLVGIRTTLTALLKVILSLIFWFDPELLVLLLVWRSPVVCHVLPFCVKELGVPTDGNDEALIGIALSLYLDVPYRILLLLLLLLW